MKILALACALALIGCADLGVTPGDDECSVSLFSSPMNPLAPAEIRVDATVSNAFGTASYTWSVDKSGVLVAYDDAQPDHSAITFTAETSGTYDVTLDVSPSSGRFCPQGAAHVNVLDGPNAGKARLHVTPPLGVDAPLLDKRIQIPEAMNYDLGPVVLDPGIVVTGLTSAPAYLQFRPLGMPDAVIETFTTTGGAYSVRLLDQPHEVVVVPETAGLAPRKFQFDPSSTTSLALTAGDAIAGTVKQGATPIANAKVQLMIDDVPTTLATTAADGSFTVRGVRVAGAMVQVEVTPPAASGLARLEVSGIIDLAGPVTVAYNALTTRNLSGTPVRRGGSAQPNKQVVIVGTVAAAGSVDGVVGTGYIRITATTDAAGGLPSLLAPAGPLYAVTTIAPGDLAIGSVDLSAGVPAQIDAPAMTPFSTKASSGTTMLDGATLDLVPTGTLALAGVATLHFTANEIGQVTGNLPTGGSFDARWADPAGRSAPFVDPDITQLQATYTLPRAVYVRGELSVTGSSNPIVGASVQILCAECTGVERSRPIAEMASDPHGAFSLAVPDPGAM